MDSLSSSISAGYTTNHSKVKVDASSPAQASAGSAPDVLRSCLAAATGATGKKSVSWGTDNEVRPFRKTNAANKVEQTASQALKMKPPAPDRQSQTQLLSKHERQFLTTLAEQSATADSQVEPAYTPKQTENLELYENWITWQQAVSDLEAPVTAIVDSKDRDPLDNCKLDEARNLLDIIRVMQKRVAPCDHEPNVIKHSQGAACCLYYILTAAQMAPVGERTIRVGIAENEMHFLRTAAAKLELFIELATPQKNGRLCTERFDTFAALIDTTIALTEETEQLIRNRAETSIDELEEAVEQMSQKILNHHQGVQEQKKALSKSARQAVFTIQKPLANVYDYLDTVDRYVAWIKRAKLEIATVSERLESDSTLNLNELSEYVRNIDHLISSASEDGQSYSARYAFDSIEALHENFSGYEQDLFRPFLVKLLKLKGAISKTLPFSSLMAEEESLDFD